jgi:hypothetical protein
MRGVGGTASPVKDLERAMAVGLCLATLVLGKDCAEIAWTITDGAFCDEVDCAGAATTT